MAIAAIAFEWHIFFGARADESSHRGRVQSVFESRRQDRGSGVGLESESLAITANGRVFGINVSTAGEQVSFLVPVKWAIALLGRTLAPEFERPSSLLSVVREQIFDYQSHYVLPRGDSGLLEPLTSPRPALSLLFLTLVVFTTDIYLETYETYYDFRPQRHRVTEKDEGSRGCPFVPTRLQCRF